MTIRIVAIADGECGVSKYPDAGSGDTSPVARLLGGQDARPSEFPWMVGHLLV